MEERIVPTDRRAIDDAFVPKLLLGAQSEHEQRLVAVRLLRRDVSFRTAVAEILEPFEMFDLDLVAEYAGVLRDEDNRGGADARRARRRQQILSRAFARADLDRMIHSFTYDDLLGLGAVTRQFFSWSMAERLLLRARRVEQSLYEATTGLYLALMVIDVVEILGASGHSPEFPEVVGDVRRRVEEASSLHISPGR